MPVIDGNLARSLVGHVLGVAAYAQPALIEVGLLDEGGLELDAACLASYARAAATFACASGSCDGESGAGATNSADIVFPTIAAGETWVVQYARIYGDGLPLFTFKFDEPSEFVEGDTPTIFRGKLDTFLSYYKDASIQ